MSKRGTRISMKINMRIDTKINMQVKGRMSRIIESSSTTMRIRRKMKRTMYDEN